MKLIDYLLHIQNSKDRHDLVQCKPLDDLLYILQSKHKHGKTIQKKKKHRLRSKRKTILYGTNMSFRKGKKKIQTRKSLYSSPSQKINFLKVISMIQILDNIIRSESESESEHEQEPVLAEQEPDPEPEHPRKKQKIIVDVTKDGNERMVIDLTKESSKESSKKSSKESSKKSSKESSKKSSKKSSTDSSKESEYSLEEHVEVESESESDSDSDSDSLNSTIMVELLNVYNKTPNDNEVIDPRYQRIRTLVIDENKRITAYSMKDPILTKLCINVAIDQSYEEMLRILRQNRENQSNNQIEYYAENDKDNINIMNCNLAYPMKNDEIDRRISCFPFQVILMLRNAFNNISDVQILDDDPSLIILKLYYYLGVDTEDKFLQLLNEDQKRRHMDYFAPGSFIHKLSTREIRDNHVQISSLSYRILYQYERNKSLKYKVIEYWIHPKNGLLTKNSMQVTVGKKHNQLFDLVVSLLQDSSINVITILFSYKRHATVFYINKEEKSSIYYNPHGLIKDHDIEETIHMNLRRIMKEHSFIRHIKNFPLSHQTTLPKCQMYCIYFCISMLDPYKDFIDKLRDFTQRDDTYDIIRFENRITNKRIMQYYLHRYPFKDLRIMK
jgi:hypothetical protein